MGADGTFQTKGDHNPQQLPFEFSVNEVRVAGVDEGIKRLYESLMENTKKYGIDNIKQPYSGDIPSIDTYLHFAILVGACKFNEALRGVLER